MSNCPTCRRTGPTIPDDADRWHSVRIDMFGLGEPLFICQAPVGAPCRSLPACQHIGGACAENDGDHSGDCPGELAPVDTGRCVVEEWINNGEETGRGSVAIPVTTQWDGNWWLWSPRAD